MNKGKFMTSLLLAATMTTSFVASTPINVLATDRAEAPASNVQKTATSLVVNKAKVLLSSETKTATIVATATYTDKTKDATVATADSTKWTTSDENVVTVNKGTLTFVGHGMATVTVEHGGKTATIAVDASIKAIAFAQKSVVARKGQDKPITVNATMSDGKVKDITSLAKVTSSAKDVIHADNGKLFFLQYGKATITAEYLGKKATVIADSEIKALTFSKTVYVPKEGAVTLGAAAKFADSTTAEDVTDVTTFEWKDNKPNFGLNKNVVAAAEAGTATVKATFGGKTAVATINSVAGQFKLNTTNFTGLVGDSKEITAAIKYADGTTETVSKKLVLKATKGAEFVTIEGNKITFKDYGTATIEASYAGKKAVITASSALKSLTANKKTINSAPGKEVAVDFEAVFATGQKVTLDPEKVKIEWTTTAKNGELKFAQNKISVSAPVKATVTAKVFGKIVTIPVDSTLKTLTPSAKEIYGDQAVGLEKLVTLTAKHADGTEVNVTEKAQWTTAAKKGEVTVTLGSQSNDSNAKDSVIVKINAFTNSTVTATYGTQKAVIPVKAMIQLKTTEKVVKGHVGKEVTIPLQAQLANKQTSDLPLNAKLVWSVVPANAVVFTGNKMKFVQPVKATVTVVYDGVKLAIPVDASVQTMTPTIKEIIGTTGEKTEQLKVAATYADGTTVDVTNKVTYKPTKDIVVTTYAEDGKPTDIKVNSLVNGQVTLTYGGKTVNIPVKAALKELKMTGVEGKTLAAVVGQAYPVTFKYVAADGKDKEVPATAITVTPKNAPIVYENGKIIVKNHGVATINVQYGTLKTLLKVDATLKSVTFRDAIIPAKPGEEIPLQEALVNDATGIVGKLSKEAFVLKTPAADGVTVTADKPTWTSSSKNVVVDAKTGSIQINGPELATITVKYAGKTASYKIDAAVKSLKTESEKWGVAANGTTFTPFKVEAVFAGDQVEDVTQKIVWKSSDKAITVVDGKLKATALAKAKVTGTYGGKTITLDVSSLPEKLTLAADKLQVKVNDEVILPEVKAFYMAGLEFALPLKSLKWTGAVVKDNKVKFAKAGTYKLTVTAYPGVTAELVIEVAEK